MMLLIVFAWESYVNVEKARSEYIKLIFQRKKNGPPPLKEKRKKKEETKAE